MNHAELFNFAGRCLAPDESPGRCSEIRERLESEEPARDGLIQICSNHLVLPALYLKLRDHGLLDVFPDGYTQQLKEIYEGNRLSNLRILEQMERISTLLGGAGISHVYMKGAGNLLGGIYSDPGERMIGDIDFLVKEEEYLEAARVLMNQGYTTRLPGECISFLFPGHHHFPRLTLQHEAATVEVHRLPVKEQYAGKLTARMVFSQCLPVEGKPHVFVPSDMHKFIQNFIHCQFSNKGQRHRTPSLRGLYDGYLLAERVNPREIEGAVENKAGVRIFYGLLSRTFHTAEAFPGDARVQRYIRTFQWCQKHRKAHIFGLQLNRIFFLIFGAYLATLIKSVYSKPYLRFTLSRLKDPAWYRQHFLLRKKQLFGG